METEKDPDDIFRDALGRFQSSLTERQRETFDTASLIEVKHQIHTMQSEQEKSKTMINFSRVTAFLTGLGQFEDVCKAVGVGIDQLSSTIWGPSKYVLQASLNPVNSFCHD